MLDDLKRSDEAWQPATIETPLEHAPSAACKAPAAPTALASENSDAEGMQRGLVGLALSGGGIRSASFCLGALQALDRFGVFPKFDYMSTVSGGGYIGASLSSLYAGGAKEFPFRHQPGVPENGYLRHLRGYCNYLAPRGMIDYLRAPGIVLRGLVVNLIVLLPFVLLLAAATVWWNGADNARVLQANREVTVRVEVNPGAAQDARPLGASRRPIGTRRRTNRTWIWPIWSQPTASSRRS